MVDVSVVIPSYKPQEYLWDCLDSFWNQTLDRNRFELVLILNGCKEPYHTNIINYKKQHPQLNIQYIQLDEGGVSNARNVGIDRSKGCYLCFVDDDDYVSPTYLEDMLSIVEEKCWPISNVIAFRDGTNETIPYSISSRFQNIKTKTKVKIMSSRGFMSTPWGKLIRKSDIGNRRFDKRFVTGEDALFVFSVSNVVKYLKPSAERAIYFRRYREGSAITSEESLYSQLQNTIRLDKAYGRCFLEKPLSYSFLFFLTRLLGGFKTICAKKKLKRKMLIKVDEKNNADNVKR